MSPLEVAPKLTYGSAKNGVKRDHAVEGINADYDMFLELSLASKKPRKRVWKGIRWLEIQRGVYRKKEQRRG